MNPKSFRLSKESRRQLAELAEWYGENESNVIRRLIAERHMKEIEMRTNAEYKKLLEIHEDTKNASGIEGHYDFDETQREFSVPQFVQAIWDAIENWDWENEDDGLAMLGVLVGIDEDYVNAVFVDDDAIVRLDRADRNVWDKIHEFAYTTAANS